MIYPKSQNLERSGQSCFELIFCVGPRGAPESSQALKLANLVRKSGQMVSKPATLVLKVVQVVPKSPKQSSLGAASLGALPRPNESQIYSKLPINRLSGPECYSGSKWCYVVFRVVLWWAWAKPWARPTALGRALGGHKCCWVGFRLP